MDFGDIISFILFLIFIAAPFLNRKKAKNTQTSDKPKQSVFSVLGKMRQFLKEAAREMETQAEQARKKEASGQNKHPRELHESPFGQAGQDAAAQTFWDQIDDREDVDFYSGDPEAQVLEPIEPVHEKSLLASPKKEPRKKSANIPKTRHSKPVPRTSFGHDTMQPSYPVSCPKRFLARSLQKAVIWSEILGKPVALRD